MINEKEIREEIAKTMIVESATKYPKGGQTCGRIKTTMRAKCEYLDVDIVVGCFRSQYDNRQLAITLFQLAVDEYIQKNK